MEIKQEFLKMYHKTLYKMIEGDTSGDYRKYNVPLSCCSLVYSAVFSPDGLGNRFPCALLPYPT